MILRWLGLLSLLGVVAFGYWAVIVRPYQFRIPVGTTVAFLGRLVQVTEHHVGAGVGAPRDPARYVYLYVDDPPPYPSIIMPLWDEQGRRWTHGISGVLTHPKGHREEMQVAQFNQLAEYRR